MAQSHESMDDNVIAFIKAQRLFFVATAPLKADGLVNLSPKGLDTFVVLDERTVAYLDLTGSGIETVAHLRENGRVVVMFCAFQGPPKIIRLQGRGEAIEPGMPDFEALVEKFRPRPGAGPGIARPSGCVSGGLGSVRAIIRIHVRRVAVSCGFGVPLMDYRGERTELDDSDRRRGEEGLREYRRKKNAASIEGLPGLSG